MKIPEEKMAKAWNKMLEHSRSGGPPYTIDPCDEELYDLFKQVVEELLGD